jgi:hypothetical protein
VQGHPLQFVSGHPLQIDATEFGSGLQAAAGGEQPVLPVCRYRLKISHSGD